MPAFKPKATKKIGKKNKKNVTVDGKHQEKMDGFNKIETSILPSLFKEKKAILKKLENKSLNIDKTLELKDRLKVIYKEIRIKKNEKKCYLLDNVEYVFDYFEKKKKLSSV